MTQLKSIFLACAALFASSAFAQDCANPLPITSQGGPHEHVAGNLCTASNSLPTMGGTPSPGNDLVYSFVAQGASASINFAIGSEATWGGQTAGIFLLPSCSVGTDPIQFGFPGTPMQVSGLTDGQTYYVVVTPDPAAPAATCGTFTADVTGTLPVTLKNFSVE